MGELRTRKPTGKVPFPMVMVEGGEKDGKSFLSYSLSKSSRVGRTFVVSLGERTVDGYARLGPYEIVEHSGTYLDIFDQVKAATEVPMEDGKPNVIVFDSGSQLWHLHALMADHSARNTARAREILAEDPDAEIDTAMPHWNKVKDKWWDLFNHLRGWPGIVVVTCRAGLVTEVVGGRPTTNTVWSRQIEKGTPFVMTAIIRARYTEGKPPLLVAVESLDVSIPAGGLELPEVDTLDHVVFKLMGAAGQFENGQLVNPSLGIDVREVRTRLIATAMAVLREADSDATNEQITAAARTLCGEAWKEAEIPADAVEVSAAQDESVTYLLGVLLKERARAYQKPADTSTEDPASVAPAGPSGDQDPPDEPQGGPQDVEEPPGGAGEPSAPPKATRRRTAPPAAAPA